MPRTPRQRTPIGTCEGCRQRAVTRPYAHPNAGAAFQLCARCHPTTAHRTGEL